MSILDDLVSNKKNLDINEVAAFASSAAEAMRQANGALDNLKQKYREIKETELTVATVQSLVSKMDSFEAKFDTFAQYLLLSKQILDQESALLNKIDEALKV